MKGKEDGYIKGNLFSGLYACLVGSAILQGSTNEGPYFMEKMKHFHFEESISHSNVKRSISKGYGMMVP